MVSIRHRSIFVHIPKCAGQSVEEAFLKDISPDLNFRAHRHLLACFERPASWDRRFPERLAHLSAIEYTSLGFIPASMWADYFKFSILRDPVDRVVSMWRYLPGVPETFEGFVFEHLPIKLEEKHFFFRSQCDHVLHPTTREPMVDELVALPDLAMRWPHIQQRAGLRTPVLRRNVSNGKPVPQVSPDARACVQRLYADDCALLDRHRRS